MKVLLLVALLALTPSNEPFFEVMSIEAYDADTYTVEYKVAHGACKACGVFIRARVRLNGFDAWETTKRRKGTTDGEISRGKAAKEFTVKRLSEASIVQIQPVKIEKYGRTLANVLVDGDDLAGILWINCHGLPYDGSNYGEVAKGCTNPRGE